MRKEFDIQTEWLGFEIHPETPRGGISITTLLPPGALDGMLQKLRDMGEPFGITFSKMGLLPNSRMAIEASEFARDSGKFDEFHEEVFRSFFTHGRDIGDVDVLAELAKGVGLDSDSLKKELAEERYTERLDQVRIETIKDGITAAPTFVIEGGVHIVGAQPLDVFREALSKH